MKAAAQAESPTKKDTKEDESKSSSSKQPEQVRKLLGSPGSPLPDDVRSFMEPRFGHSFADVRVHTGSAAASAAASVGALAYTVGNNVVFGSGQFQPGTPSGQRLLAHELTHVVQQRPGRSSTPALQRKGAVREPGDRSEREADHVADQVMNAAGVPAQEQKTTADPPVPRVQIVESVQKEDISRQEAPGGAPDAAVPAKAPAAAVEGSLDLSSATLTRGDKLTARFVFDTSGGASANVTSWTYISDSDTVTRNKKETDFQTKWEGVMALSGTLGLDYDAKPSAGDTATSKSLSKDITVNDRTGATWLSTVKEKGPVAFTGKPSPPKKFRDLGRHSGFVKRAAPTSKKLTAGPNTGFSYVSALSAGTYTSTPKIHPDVHKKTSRFWKFHQDKSRLYFKPDKGTRRLIAASKYSDLTTSPGSGPTFKVPNWEAFYKENNVFSFTASATIKVKGKDKKVTKKVKDEWWGFVTDKVDGTVKITDEKALRAALKIKDTDGYSVESKTNGSWEGFELLASDKIETGTRGHEYKWDPHSHRANFVKTVKALDPQRRIEARVSTPSAKLDFKKLIKNWSNELTTDDQHKLVDETEMRNQEKFVLDDTTELRGINQDDSGDVLGTVWNIKDDKQMT